LEIAHSRFAVFLAGFFFPIQGQRSSNAFFESIPFNFTPVTIKAELQAGPPGSGVDRLLPDSGVVLETDLLLGFFGLFTLQASHTCPD
jgi:hypothetical protein